MKTRFAAILSIVLFGLANRQAFASVVLSNLDPANADSSIVATQLGQAMLTGNRPIVLSSVEFLQGVPAAASQTFAVYSRKTDGTLGTVLFSGFTLSTNGTIITAATTGAFTLQANTGYWFVLTNAGGTDWSDTLSTDYAAAFGVSLPTTNSSFATLGSTFYYPLSHGPQEIQVNGTALAAVPEPSTWAFLGFALAGGVAVAARRRVAGVA